MAWHQNGHSLSVISEEHWHSFFPPPLHPSTCRFSNKPLGRLIHFSSISPRVIYFGWASSARWRRSASALPPQSRTSSSTLQGILPVPSLLPGRNTIIFLVLYNIWPYIGRNIHLKSNIYSETRSFLESNRHRPVISGTLPPSVNNHRKRAARLGTAAIEIAARREQNKDGTARFSLSLASPSS